MIVEIVRTRSTKRFPIMSWIIMAWETVKALPMTVNWSHFSFTYISETGRRMFLDSTSNNISESNEEQFLKHHKIIGVDQVVIPGGWFEWRVWMQEHLGKKYPMGQLIFSIGLKLMMFQNGSSAMPCNELILRGLLKFKKIKLEKIDMMGLNDTQKVVDLVKEK